MRCNPNLEQKSLTGSLTLRKNGFSFKTSLYADLLFTTRVTYESETLDFNRQTPTTFGKNFIDNNRLDDTDDLPLDLTANS